MALMTLKGMEVESMKITLIKSPTEEDWQGVKQRALVTVGKSLVNAPDLHWKRAILDAEHGPIKYLEFSFLLEDVPSYVSVHLVRHHVGCTPYVRSQRNDRQNDYDRETAPQGTPVNMIWDLNAPALIRVAHQRLCGQADPKTRDVVRQMCRIVIDRYPEFEGILVPTCEYRGMRCHEMYPCGRME